MVCGKYVLKLVDWFSSLALMVNYSALHIMNFVAKTRFRCRESARILAVSMEIVWMGSVFVFLAIMDMIVANDLVLTTVVVMGGVFLMDFVNVEMVTPASTAPPLFAMSNVASMEVSVIMAFASFVVRIMLAIRARTAPGFFRVSLFVKVYCKGI